MLYDALFDVELVNFLNAPTATLALGASLAQTMMVEEPARQSSHGLK